MAPNFTTPAKHPASTSKTKASNFKSSSLRPTTTPSTQFAPTPRFTFGSTQRTKNEAKTPQTQYSSPLNRRPVFIQAPKEEIDDVSSDLEHETGFDATLPLRSPDHKRRRTGITHPKNDAIVISSSPPASPTSPPPLSPPQSPLHGHSQRDAHFPMTDIHHHFRPPATPAPPSHRSATHDPPQTPKPPQHLLQTPRFRLPPSTPFPPPSTQTHTNSTLSTIPTRPPLILPPRPPSPEPTQSAFFSPSRRGQTYVPGGLAAMVKGWVVEAGDRGVLARGRDRRVRVGRVKEGERGSVMVVAEGDGEVAELDEEGEGVEDKMDEEVDGADEGERWILVDGQGREVREGQVVGIKEPTWEVEFCGKVWRVCVEWRVVEVDKGKDRM